MINNIEDFGKKIGYRRILYGVFVSTFIRDAPIYWRQKVRAISEKTLRTYNKSLINFKRVTNTFSITLLWYLKKLTSFTVITF